MSVPDGDVNSTVANNKNRGPPGRSSKRSSPPNCTWCADAKVPLKYVFPTQNGSKEFCSETCISEFRKAYSKGACAYCDNVIRNTALNKKYCSTFCMNKHQRKNNHENSTSPSSVSSTSTTSTLKVNTVTSQSQPASVNNLLNNNNSNVNNNNSNNRDNSSGVGPFQYESFNVFNWDEYLQVRITTWPSFSFHI